MATVAIFHSDLGVRAGVRDAARRLTEAGHDAHVIDYYGDGRSFNDHESAGAYVESVGFPRLMQNALDAVADLPDGFATLGFSNGAGMAEFIALQRLVSRVVLGSGALPLAMIGSDAWPDGTAVQFHQADEDPFRNNEWLQSFVASVRASHAPIELFADYPGDGHLFTDATLDDFDATNTELFWQRVLAFLSERGSSIISFRH